MSGLLIDITVHIARPVADVYRAWTTADALASWFAPMATQKPDVELDFVEGGRYSIKMALPDGSVHTTVGLIQKIVPNELIEMTWHCDAFDDPESLLTVRFVASGSGTDIQVRHETFESTTTCDAHRAGWEACLAGLSNFLD